MLIIGEFVLSVTVFLMRLFNNPHSLGAGKYWEDVVICIPIIMWMLVFILPGISAIFPYIVFWTLVLVFCLKKYRSNCKGIKDAVENREYVVANGSVLSIENRYRGRYRIIKHAGIGRRQIYDSALEPVVAHKISEGAEGLIVIPQIPTAKMQVVVFAVSKHMFICSR